MPRKQEPTLRTECFRIESYMKQAGTYQPYYRDSVEHLASLYLDLIALEEEITEDGGGIMVSLKTKAGYENRMNPAYQAKYKILEECRAFEKVLGLTPESRWKILGDEKEKRESSLGAALRVLSS